jgi:hypothetical protein
MATILDILIQTLNIDCSVAQCSGYASEIEAMFYLFFFPTIFIILFIYILTSFIFRGGGKVRGLKLLIAIGVYAFIVFEHMFTSVVAISRLWWLLTIILVGLFAFIRFLFTGGREGEARGGLSGVGGGGFGEFLHHVVRRVWYNAEEEIFKNLGLETRGEKFDRQLEDKKNEILKKLEEHGASGLNPSEKGLLLIAFGGRVKDLKAIEDEFKKWEDEKMRSA